MINESPASRSPLPPERIKHLELVADVITRMNANAFFAKAWSVTIAAALFAAAGKADVKHGALIVVFTSVALWGLDAYYLSLERQFRKLFESVAKGNATPDFLMDPSQFRTGRATWRSSLLSPSMIIHPIVAVTAGLWAFAGSLWAFAGGLWAFAAQIAR